jgi:hypothetical protein
LNSYSRDDVFKVLELNVVGNELLESPLLNIWAKVMVQFNKLEPEEMTSWASHSSNSTSTKS